MGHKGIGLTDHDSLSGHIKALEIYKEVKKEYPNFKLVLGNEIYLCRNGLNSENFEPGVDKYYHFLLLALDDIGHKQLRELSTRAWGRSYVGRGMRRVPTYYDDLIDIVQSNPGHLVATSACLGSALGSQLLDYKENKNKKTLEKVKQWCRLLESVFGEGFFFLEMQPSTNEEQIFVNKEIIKLSHELEIPTTINSDAHYLRPKDRDTHRAYLRSQNGEREVDAFYGFTYLMKTEEIYELMEDYLGEDEIQKAFNTTNKILSMAKDYELEKPLKIPVLAWRDFSHLDRDLFHKYKKEIPTLEIFHCSEDRADKEMVWAIIDAIERKTDLQNKEAYNEIDLNLKMIEESSRVNNASWSTYLLNLQKIVDLCWEAGTLVGAGRGSGIGFILLYLLEITQINPLRENTKTHPWRFLNAERVTVLDVDIDINAAKRQKVFDMFHEVYGEDRVSNVVTFRTEKSKSAIRSAMRGLGYNADEAGYVASLIPSDRGNIRTLNECMYGDKENKIRPIKQFVIEMTHNYPDVWTVATGIEDLISGSGIHAGGVVFVDEPFIQSGALMRAPDGTLCTQYELNDLEKVSNIKYDILSIEALDKMQMCLELLSQYGYIEREKTLKETYEKILGVYNLERDNKEMWKLVHDHKINSLFQLTLQTGIDGIDTLKPASVDDLAILNSSIRLMAQERGSEMPTNKVARFKHNPEAWEQEMTSWRLTEEEKDSLRPHLETSYGVCIVQEQFMAILQMPIAGGVSLQWADRARKAVARKIPSEFDALEKEYYEISKENDVSFNMAQYVWKILVTPQAGYGFNSSHTLAYSIIALQEMNLAYRFPIIFWDCACLIVDSGGTTEDIYTDHEYLTTKTETGSTDYGKIASAIGKMKSIGVKIEAPSVNNSGFTFLPNVEDNSILYGLNGLTKINDSLVKEIILNRPYTSIKEFDSKIKTNVTQKISLIKSGCFDEFEDRIKTMKKFLKVYSSPKKRINLQNMKMLIDFKLLPKELSKQEKVWNFNRYIKKHKLDKNFYKLDKNSYRFIDENYGIDNMLPHEDGFKITQAGWEDEYQRNMDIVRPYVKENHDELLKSVNEKLFNDTWDKYATGSISKWEMDSMSCYIHEHELEKIDHEKQGWANFFALDEEPEIDYSFKTKSGKIIHVYKIERIAGTVLDRDTNKRLVTLLTTEGVVVIRFFGGLFEQYDKQISEHLPNGRRKIIEKSIFTRGNKIIICGLKRGQMFIAKKYKQTPYHTVEEIIGVDEQGKPIIKKGRTGQADE